MPIVIGLGDTDWNDPLNIYGGKPTAAEPPKPAPATGGGRKFTLSDQDRQDLRKTIAAEAAGEGETGMIAVGNVIRNRAERRGKNLADVVREPKQFTGYEAPGEGALKILQDPDQLAKIDSIIDQMASGELPDVTGGADHYHADYVSPDWAGKMPKTTQVGSHLFYKAESGPDTRRKDMPTYGELAGQIGLDGDPFEAVLKGGDAAPTERKPKGRGMADLLPDEPEPMKGNGGALAFVNAGQDKIAPTFRSVLEGASQDLGRGLTVLSGFRAPTHAVEARKKNPGEHSRGTASDISMKGMNEQERKTLVQSLLARGAKRFITYSSSPDMLHVDMKDQQGNGQPWFMHDKSNRNLGRAPGWFQEIANDPTAAQQAITAQTSAASPTAAPGNTIVIDESFAANDPMGLLAGGNPFAAIADEAKSKRVAEETQVADQFEQNRITGMTQVANRETEARRAELEAESPGRYVEMTAEEVPEFQRQWEEENRSDGVLGDTGRILKSGAIGVGQTLTSLADTIFSNIPGGEVFLKASDDIDRWAMGQTLDQRMDTAKAQTNASVTKEQSEADAKNWWDSENGTFGPAWRDPRSYLRTVGESVPATVVTMAPGGIMARGAYLRTLAATGSERAAAAAAAKTATMAGALLEGTMGGADTARAVRDRIDAIPREQLIETETVRALIDGGMSEDEALTALTTDASTKAFAIAGVATGMFGGMGDRALAKILAEGVGGNIAQRMLTGGVRGMVAEGLLEEAPQGAAQTIAGNIGVRDANPDQELTEGMGEAVASGIAGGGVMGGGMGAAGGAVSRQGAASAADPVEDVPTAPPAPAPAAQPRGPIGRSVQHAEQQITQRQAAAAPADVIPAPQAVTESLTPAPSASPPDAAPAQDGRPQVGATVRIDADGIEPFMGRVDGYEGDDAVIIDGASGEVYQIPIGNLTEIAKPMEAIPDRGPQPVNDAIPEFSTDPALEPMAPAAAEVRSEGLPPRLEQKEATERFPSAPTAGQRVIVDDENGGRFVATVQQYENGGTEALIRTDDGKDLQVPVSSLKVSKLTPKQVEAQELERNPPIEREVADAGPTSRSVLGKTIVMPDDKHARLFDLGKMRQSSRRTIGTSQLDLDRVDPRELKALANEFGIPEQAIGQLADDYATRMVRNVRSANSKLPQRMPPVMDTILARWRREVVDADTTPAADETQSWWDRELDDEGRRLAMISANIKRPPKTPWVDLSPAMQRKLRTVRSELQAAEAAANAVDSTEANSVESEVSDGASNSAVTPKPQSSSEVEFADKGDGFHRVARFKGAPAITKDEDGSDRAQGITFWEDDAGVHIADTYLPPADRGKGNGFALYKRLAEYAETQSKPLFSDTDVSASALRVYDRLAAAGYDVRRSANFRDGTGEGRPGKFVGGRDENGRPTDGFTIKVSPRSGIDAEDLGSIKSRPAGGDPAIRERVKAFVRFIEDMLAKDGIRLDWTDVHSVNAAARAVGAWWRKYDGADDVAPYGIVGEENLQALRETRKGLESWAEFLGVVGRRSQDPEQGAPTYSPNAPDWVKDVTQNFVETFGVTRAVKIVVRGDNPILDRRYDDDALGALDVRSSRSILYLGKTEANPENVNLLVHELGHLLHYDAFSKMTDAERAALATEYLAWMAENPQSERWAARSPEVKMRDGRGQPIGEVEYLYDVREFFADMTARYALSSNERRLPKMAPAIDRVFGQLASFWRKLHDILRRQNYVTESFESFMDKYVERMHRLGVSSPRSATTDQAANEAATSPTNDLPEPTPAQKEAGNYKVGRISLGGLDISIENPAGSERKGLDGDGKPWSVTMKSHYGYIRGTVGRDKDHIDVFVKAGTEALEGTAPVFVVDQVNPDGSFDEHKVMLGYGSQREAEAAYLENYTKGWKLGPVSSTMFGEFKQWLRKGDTTEGAASAVNERYFDDAATQARAEEVDRPKPTVAQIHKDMANRVSPADFARRVAALGRNSQESAVIEPSGKLLVLKPTSNPFGDHAEFFERLTEAGVDTTESTGYVRITSSGNQIGASSSGPISDPAVATLRAVQTAAAREGLTFVGEGVEQPAAQADPAGRDTERTVNGKRLAFPDKYHAAVFDLGQQLLSEAGVAEVRAGTSIDDVVPEAATLTKAQRTEAERLVSTIGSYMDPVVSSADEMAIAAMEIAAMEMEVAASKKGDGEVQASSVIDVEAQQEWAQAIIDEMSKGQPVTARQPMETGAAAAATGPSLAFSADDVAAPATLKPKPNKQADPDPIMPTDPKFRRLPVPDRPASTPLFTWAKDAVLERGRRTGNEHLIAIDDDGTVVEFGTSDKPKFVGLNARLSKAVANPDRRIVFIHNHPRNWPLSVGDVAMLANPGAYSVWALGHDGRETRASLTERAQSAVRLGSAPDDVINSIERFEKALRDAEKGLEAIIGGKIADGTITVEQAEEAHFNAILEVGQRAGVIDFTTNQPYDPSNIPMLDRAIDNAALKLARTLLDERAAPQTSDARVLRQAVSVQHVGELGTVAGDRSDVEGRDEGQRGLREGGARDYQSEAQGRNARRLTGSRRISENSIVEAISGKWTDLNPTVLATVPLNYFVELARPNMTAVKEYMSVKRLMDAYRGDKHANADAIAGDWLKYMRLGFGKTNKAKAQELADLMHESTLAGIDPSLTDDETKAKAGYEILRKRYQALPASGKELFGKVRDAYRAQADELDQILLDNVRKSQQIAKDQAEARYRKKLEEIRDAKMNPIDRRKAEEDAASRYKSESTKMDWSAKARLTKLRIQFESNRVPAPYFPLGRFGQYYVTAKDVDGSVISFSKFERAADRDRFAREIQRDYPGAAVTKGVMKDMTDPRAAMDPRMVAEIEQLLGNAGVDQDLMDMVYQRYLETLPELSMRKRYMHRKGTAGFDTDALRVFSSHMFHAAHQMAKLKYGLELQELVNTTFDQAEAADDQTRAMRLANEMASRHKWVMNPTGGSVAQTMTSTAFVWFLAASPAAAVLNLTQTLMMGLPILGTRFGGIGRASVEVAKASADLISGKGSVRDANLTREEAAAVDAFYRSGMIDRTQSHDLAGVGDTGVKYSPLRSRVMAVMSWAFHNTEVWNRETTALAAYRLARKAGQSHLDAIDSAHDLTWKTHFDYSNSSRPRIMQNDFAKVALVFRSYSINMLYRMFRDIHQSVKGESPQARREARYQLAGVTGMMALMAGVTGTFGFNLMMGVAGLVFGDDDDPMDFEERFKADVIDILGPELGGVVLKGVPGHYMGVDLTSRIGMPDLWFRSPGQDLQGKEEWNYWISQVLGATAGIGEQWFRGASLIMEGDVARGVEVAAPKFIRDPMKAFRYASEGLQSIRGDELLPADAIGIHGAVAQAMGVSPSIVSETWERSGALKNAEKRVMDERQRVVNAWAMAALEGDKEGVAEAIERVRKFNKKPVHSAIPITQDTLKRSIKTRVRNAAKREDGVLIQNEILSQRLRAAMPERLY